MDKELAEYISQKYIPTKRCEADAAVIDKYRNVLPSNLIGAWEIVGFSGFDNGLFWLVNPEVYEGVIADWLDGTGLPEDGSYFCIARGAFGDLQILEAKSGAIINISPALGFISLDLSEISKESDLEDKEEIILSWFVMQRKGAYDISLGGKGIFNDAFNRLGHLEHDELYGFEPALTLDGNIKIERLSRVKGIAHLSLLREFSNPVVKNINI
ncbi:DUF1851 domain-containing protein [Zooshikella marina]|uniref:GAD-like domain-containing protein n=1 Tax=Zooshikella ganghwensis TaxID=202772 RepID=UPI001BAF3B54|nr:GAD-like domain-containing protein [Zooshikella ganghwensis]MBU2709026.1 DUF1851 domain-containing protein [Zooshikella ganghwensis]